MRRVATPEPPAGYDPLAMVPVRHARSAPRHGLTRPLGRWLARRLTSAFAGLALATLLLPGAGPATVRAANPVIRSQIVQAGLQVPWDVDFTPDGRMLVSERSGTLRIYANGEPGAALLATNRVSYVRSVGEAGLMGIAVDRSFAVNHRIYVCASRDDYGRWLNQVLRYRIDAWNRLIFEKAVIRLGAAAAPNHDGCAVEMFSDGMVWVTIGDAGVAARAQDPRSLNGKVLRVTPDGGVPANNPIMPGTTTPSLVFSMGHRNPQGIATQPGTGAVYAVEHGPERDDEVNRIYPGANYGWPCYTGTGIRNSSYTGRCGPSTAYRNPAWASGAVTWATSGGTFAAGANWGSFSGQLFVSCLKESDVRRFQLAGTTLAYRQTLFDGTWGRLRAMTRGPRNALYVTTGNGTGDRVIRITAG